MKKESIDEAINVITVALGNSNIDRIDKCELEINLYNFLKSYDENRRVLSEYKLQRRYEDVQVISDDKTYTYRHK